VVPRNLLLSLDRLRDSWPQLPQPACTRLQRLSYAYSKSSPLQVKTLDLQRTDMSVFYLEPLVSVRFDADGLAQEEEPPKEPRQPLACWNPRRLAASRVVTRCLGLTHSGSADLDLRWN